MASVDADSVKVNGSSGDFSIMNVHGDNVIISAGKGLLEGYNIKAAKVGPVSYTHLDVYKRQQYMLSAANSLAEIARR